MPLLSLSCTDQQSTSGVVLRCCPYGYFDYAPYDCAPYGYYGPDWFNGGIFIGAGPWFHGPHGFYGHVDNRYDPHHGYGGPASRTRRRSPSTTSRAMKRVMVRATSATQPHDTER